jgi:hypothetical protein
MNYIPTERKFITVFYYQNQKNYKKFQKQKHVLNFINKNHRAELEMTAVKLRTSLRTAFDAATRPTNFVSVQTARNFFPG